MDACRCLRYFKARSSSRITSPCEAPSTRAIGVINGETLNSVDSAGHAIAVCRLSQSDAGDHSRGGDQGRGHRVPDRHFGQEHEGSRRASLDSKVSPTQVAAHPRTAAPKAPCNGTKRGDGRYGTATKLLCPNFRAKADPQAPSAFALAFQHNHAWPTSATLVPVQHRPRSKQARGTALRARALAAPRYVIGTDCGALPDAFCEEGRAPRFCSRASCRLPSASSANSHSGVVLAIRASASQAAHLHFHGFVIASPLRT